MSRTGDEMRKTFGSGSEADGTIRFGKYDWRVLKVGDGKALLLTECSIEHRMYHGSYEQITWGESDLRAYLNHEFFDTFSPEEQTCILLTRLNNEVYQGAGGEYDTEDRIFLLSDEEANTLLPNCIAIYDGTTRVWTTSLGDQLSVRKGNTESWLLRLRGRNDYVDYVRYDGATVQSGTPVGAAGQVRPALWLDLPKFDELRLARNKLDEGALQRLSTVRTQIAQSPVARYRGCIAVDGWGEFTVGLKSDGTVAASGDNQCGQCDTETWYGIVAVAASSDHTVGLKSDGTVVAVGDNTDGQCYTDGWQDIAAVSASSGHTVGLKSDGTVVAAGKNEYGQCNTENWYDIIAVIADSDRTIGLKSDGTVVAAGRNDCGQCGTSDWHDIVAIAAGSRHTVGLRSDGRVVAVGENEKLGMYRGQCATEDWRDIVAVDACDIHTIGLKSDGTVVATSGPALGSSSCNIENWRDIVMVTTGAFHTVGLKSDGSVVATDTEVYGYDISGWRDIVAIGAGYHHTVGLKLNGTVVMVGDDGLSEDQSWLWSDIGPISMESLLREKKRREEELRRDEEDRLREAEDIRRAVEERRHEEELRRIQSELWVKQGLCRHCGGKLSIFGKKCKSCGRAN